MKILIVIAFLLMIGACSGDIGPPGPQGEPGAPAPSPSPSPSPTSSVPPIQCFCEKKDKCFARLVGQDWHRVKNCPSDYRW